MTQRILLGPHSGTELARLIQGSWSGAPKGSRPPCCFPRELQGSSGNRAAERLGPRRGGAPARQDVLERRAQVARGRGDALLAEGDVAVVDATPIGERAVRQEHAGLRR